MVRDDGFPERHHKRSEGLDAYAWGLGSGSVLVENAGQHGSFLEGHTVRKRMHDCRQVGTSRPPPLQKVGAAALAGERWIELVFNRTWPGCRVTFVWLVGNEAHWTELVLAWLGWMVSS